MKSYKVVVRYRHNRYAPFARTYKSRADYVYKRVWFPRNGKPGPWLPVMGPVAQCRVGWHFARGTAQLGTTPATFLRRASGDQGWPVYIHARRDIRGIVEVWEIHYRQAIHWDDQSAARTIRFIRRLSRDEAVALMEGT